MRLDVDILRLDIDILRPDINTLRPDIDILRPDINIVQRWVNNSVFEYYSNYIRITNYLYSYSVIFGRTNIIRSRIRSFSEDWIFFVFIFGHFWKTEYYSYSYSCSVIFRRPNNIHIRIWFSKHYSLTSDIVRLDIDLSYLSPLCIWNFFISQNSCLRKFVSFIFLHCIELNKVILSRTHIRLSSSSLY